MKNITKSLIAGGFALAFFAQPALAYDGRRDHYDHYWHHEHERIVYHPAPAFYYPVQRVAYYPQPVYAVPVTSFGFVIR